ncbi:MAG TPA: isopentenyl phosphate kinase [Bellilinea sp.]|nr:isopentenyl phosphate kinase [Bellilinea sp.]
MILFLKLGGSLITDKLNARTARKDTIQRLAGEIQSARLAQPDVQFVLGHGSGSFGHVPADKYHTRRGVHSWKDWEGFLEVWRQARELNQIMLEELTQVGMPVMAFPPSAFIQAADGQPATVQADPLRSALQAGLVPLVAGDVIFDRVLGGTIFSTEDVFLALAPHLLPDRILICGMEAGVWQDFPANTELITHITPSSFKTLDRKLSGSAGIDVTGGMRTKVDQMVALVSQFPQAQVQIFSGEAPGTLSEVLMGHPHGTLITNTEGDEA